jgi:hypothetical protein
MFQYGFQQVPKIDKNQVNVAAADDPDRLTSQIRRGLCRVGSALFADTRLCVQHFKFFSHTAKGHQARPIGSYSAFYVWALWSADSDGDRDRVFVRQFTL